MSGFCYESTASLLYLSHDAAFKSKHESKRGKQWLVRGNMSMQRGKTEEEKFELPTVHINALK